MPSRDPVILEKLMTGRETQTGETPDAQQKGGGKPKFSASSLKSRIVRL
jgi:hypothetical protein